jgi:Kef-type K+ transport system membrane component KefB
LEEFDVEIVLLQLFVLVLLARMAAAAFTRIGVPALIGEILVGILVFNLSFSPDAPFIAVEAGGEIWQALKLDQDTSIFETFSELGVIFLLFTVGLETRFSDLKAVGRTASMVAILGVIIPFGLGYTILIADGGGSTEAMFIGAAMVATSVGITARVIRDMNLTHSLESKVIVGAAVIDDILGMIVLAIVAGVAESGGFNLVDIAIVSAEAVLFVLGIIFIGTKVLPRSRHIKDRRACEVEPSSHFSPLALALIVCFGLSALAAYINLAAIIGAFLAGMLFAEFKDIWPCEEHFEPINEFLVPFFFLFVGFSVDLSSFGDVWVLAAIITVAAVASKFIGCGLGAWPLGKKEATIIGIGMVPRGEVGIIVAAIGERLGVVSPGVFAVVVFMSLATTLIAPPLLAYAFKKKLGGVETHKHPDTSL